MSDHSTSSGPAGSEHDGHDRSETGTAHRAMVGPINITVSAFVYDGHTVLVSGSGLAHVRIAFQDEHRTDIDLYFRSQSTLDRLAEAVKIAKTVLANGDDVQVCVTHGDIVDPRLEVSQAA